MPMPICEWGALPFRGREGDAVTPLCLVAFEMRSGRLVRLWQDELGRFPPYRLDSDALFIG